MGRMGTYWDGGGDFLGWGWGLTGMGGGRVGTYQDGVWGDDGMGDGGPGTWAF